MIKKQMNIQEIIQEMLNRDPENGNTRNILFWYDSDKEFVHEIDGMTFENTKVIILNDDASFKVKYQIEVADKESNFLLYAPYEKPSDRENWLLDIQKYSDEFTTDRAVYEMRRLGITDESVKAIIKKNMKFFENEKRVNKLKSFGIEEYDPLKLEIAIVSSLAKLKTADFDELIRILITDYINDNNKLVGDLEKYGDLDSFYELVKNRFGYMDEKLDIDGFIATLVYTAFAYEYVGKLPKELDKLKSSRVSEIVVFVDEFLSLDRYKKDARKLSERYEDLLRIKEILSAVETEAFIGCDTFKVIDDVVIHRIIRGITEGLEDYDTWIRHAKERRSKHWYSVYENEYKAIINGLELLKHYDQISSRLALESVDDYFDMYISEYHKLDYNYRKFLYHYDRIEDRELLSSLNDYIENVYVSSFLDTLSINWSSIVERRGNTDVDRYKYKKQLNFYNDYVRGYVKDKERIFVVISDAMRYEIATELVTELMKERRAEIKLNAMQGGIPSYTKFGMANLLPNSDMSYDMESDIKIKGITTKGTINREKILKTVQDESIAIRYDDLKHMKKIDYKKTFSGKKLVYIYHDTIDKYGHNGNPFDAVEIAIDELRGLVRSLVNNVSATKIIITADHGFIYQRSKLEEYDKISKVKNDAVIESDRRFILSKENVQDMNLINLPFNETMKTDSPIHVIVPKGTIRFKTQGEGGNFVHGGASLQEIVVPVIEYFDKRSDEFKASKVEVQLTSISRKLTNRISYLEFFQKESVSDKKLPLNLKLYINDEDGNRVSNEVMIIADSDSGQPADRSFREKFVLKDLKYKKEDIYYLVFEDDEETINPVLNKIPFTIDLAIVNNFGF